MSQVVVVVPCYNESERFSAPEFTRLLGDPRLRLLLVDDGSSDTTLQTLEGFRASAPERVDVLHLERNRGKAEAVRAGLLRALQGDRAAVGYIDADFATPVEEVVRLVDRLFECGADAVIGARVARMGADIERSAARHYLGRIFATCASLTLRHSIYDTQCGAKFFRASPALSQVLAQPFSSRWAFDVELLGRLLKRQHTIVEVPLNRWRDVGGSKMNARSMIRAGLDLVQIARALRKSG